MSGTYSFRALFEGRHHSCAERGSLEFDWMGDVSGQALAEAGKRGALSAPGRCDVLISGTYSPAANPGSYRAKLTLTPLSPDYPIDHGRDETLKATIFPRDNRGDLELLAHARSGREFVGVAKRQAPGPS